MTKARKKPNKSAAASSARIEPRDGLDDWPTLPWAVRAWVYMMGGKKTFKGKTIWEPAANRGYMALGLECSGAKIVCSDVFDYGVGFPTFDFLSLGDTLLPAERPAFVKSKPDWIVTNPPFNNLNDFIHLAMRNAKIGCAMFCRITVYETLDRLNYIFQPLGLRWMITVFPERVSLVKGTVDPTASQPVCYAWLTIRHKPFTPEFITAHRHFPICRSRYEKPGNYRLLDHPKLDI